MESSHEMTFVEGISVTPIGADRFTGRYPNWNGYGRVFGGNLLAHAVSPVYPTVDPFMSLHSIHGYFLRPTSARSVIRGTLHSADGVLRLSMAQELLIREIEGEGVGRAEHRWIEEGNR